MQVRGKGCDYGANSSKNKICIGVEANTFIINVKNQFWFIRQIIRLTGRGGSYGWETWRFPYFLDSLLTDGGEVSALRAGRALPPRKIRGIHFSCKLGLWLEG
jgi:hypothetical protein